MAGTATPASQASEAESGRAGVALGGDNVGFGLRMDRVKRAEASRRVNEALALVGLEDYGDRTPAELSGGLSSASRWRVPSSSVRPFCCSTNRSVRST